MAEFATWVCSVIFLKSEKLQLYYRYCHTEIHKAELLCEPTFDEISKKDEEDMRRRLIQCLSVTLMKFSKKISQGWSLRALWLTRRKFLNIIVMVGLVHVCTEVNATTPEPLFNVDPHNLSLTVFWNDNSIIKYRSRAQYTEFLQKSAV